MAMAALVKYAEAIVGGATIKADLLDVWLFVVLIVQATVPEAVVLLQSAGKAEAASKFWLAMVEGMADTVKLAKLASKVAGISTLLMRTLYSVVGNRPDGIVQE
jgi:hypothetical protein